MDLREGGLEFVCLMCILGMFALLNALRIHEIPDFRKGPYLRGAFADAVRASRSTYLETLDRRLTQSRVQRVHDGPAGARTNARPLCAGCRFA